MPITLQSIPVTIDIASKEYFPAQTSLVVGNENISTFVIKIASEASDVDCTGITVELDINGSLVAPTVVDASTGDYTLTISDVALDYPAGKYTVKLKMTEGAAVRWYRGFVFYSEII